MHNNSLPLRFGLLFHFTLLFFISACSQPFEGSPFEGAEEPTPEAMAKHIGDESFSEASTSSAKLKNSSFFNSRAKAQSTKGTKLVYNASVKVAVKSYSKSETKIKGIVKNLGGYISETNEKSQDEAKEGTLTLRIPSKKFNQAIKNLKQLGNVLSSRQWTEDVTEQYVDVTTRIKNQLILEERLLKLLQHPNSKLNDLINVESKIAEVREKIEQSQGKLRYLENKISLSTITLNVFEPDTTASEQESIAYPLIWAGQHVAYIFFGSLALLMLAFFGLIPWLLVGYFLLPFIRRRRKRNKLSQNS